MGIQHKGIYRVVRPFACIQLKQNTSKGRTKLLCGSHENTHDDKQKIPHVILMQYTWVLYLLGHCLLFKLISFIVFNSCILFLKLTLKAEQQKHSNS